jgi:phosphoribosyl-ATP pyrophosphohydrolase/phosphoribosyl-AMP cyclohydrolase
MSSTIEFIGELEAIIESRRAADTKSSYTKQLFDRGTPYIAQKVGEEAVELAIAAVLGDPKNTLSEAADLMYHLLVLLNANDLKLADVANELAERHR